jgi:microcystin-dependent protein
MSDQFVGEVRIFAGSYAPSGWALCNGGSLPIAGNEELYSLIGTIYGGDGHSNFNLPDLRSRIPVGTGASAAGTLYKLGQTAGTETVVLQQAQIPLHVHNLMANSSAATTGDPTNNYLAQSANSSGGTNADAHYLSSAVSAPTVFQLNTNAVATAGQSAAHPNVMPSYCVNFIIALTGFYPQFQ